MARSIISNRADPTYNRLLHRRDESTRLRSYRATCWKKVNFNAGVGGEAAVSPVVFIS